MKKKHKWITFLARDGRLPPRLWCPECGQTMHHVYVPFAGACMPPKDKGKIERPHPVLWIEKQKGA